MKKHDMLISKLGKKTFEDYANRIRKSAVSNADIGSADKMFSKLQLSIREPDYPDTIELDKILFSKVIKEIDIHASIPKNLILKLDECERKFA
jgi:hypothetical protein